MSQERDRTLTPFGVPRMLRDSIHAYIEESIHTQERVLQALAEDIELAARLMAQTILEGRKILFCGNGGSAADAQHLAAELVGRFEKDRKALPALSLSTDTSILTAVANDYAFEEVFSRQVEALGMEGDLLVGITTSGNSANVIRALDRAKALGLKTIALTGRDGGRIKTHADIVLIVPSQRTCHIQESHIMIGQLLCELVEKIALA